jgi:RNA-directed DNA polymerase
MAKIIFCKVSFIMKSYNNLWQKFISFNNLYNAYILAKKSKPRSFEITNYFFNYEKELFSLQKELITNNYVFGPYSTFKIYKPKERTIKFVSFKDRVLHHAIQKIIEPIFEKSFIYDSYACRKNKGIHKGLFRLKKIIQSKNPPKYFLKCDIKKYFLSIDQDILKKIISKKIKDKKLLTVIFKIIDSDHSEFGAKKGIPIGNLTSQLFSNIYLNELDQFVKNKLKIKHYFRYVDDFLIFSDSKKELHMSKEIIRKYLNKELKLDLPINKAKIRLTKTGVDFVGYQIYPDFVRVRSINIKRFKKRTKKLLIKYNTKKLTRSSLESSINSFFGYLKHADCIKLKNKLQKDFCKF